MIPRLKILIDPIIKKRYGPEVCWTWRVVLSSIGYGWEEVRGGSREIDIAYVSDPDCRKTAKFYVHSDMNLWDRKASLKLKGVKRDDALSYPVYVGQTSRNLPGVTSEGQILCARDVIFDVFWLITGQEEGQMPKHRHGFIELSGTAFLEGHVLRNGLASGLIAWLERILRYIGHPTPLARWPYNRRAAACLTHDVDYPEVKRFLEPARIVARRGLSGLNIAKDVIVGKKNHWHFDSWMKLETELGVRSAFYFSAVRGSILRYLLGVPDPFYDVKSEMFRQLFRNLTDGGFEIGLHASYSAFKSKDKFLTERRILEEASGQEIKGNRHHYWHLNPADIESTLKMHEEIGLHYDTSLAHERYMGWRRAISMPFFPFHRAERRELKTLQIPTTWMDNQLFGYRNDNPGDREEILKDLIERTSDNGGCIVVDVHDYVFDDALFPGWRKTYSWFLGKVKQRGDFWIATPREVADHWLRRYSTVKSISDGLNEGLAHKI